MMDSMKDELEKIALAPGSVARGVGLSNFSKLRRKVDVRRGYRAGSKKLLGRAMLAGGAAAGVTGLAAGSIVNSYADSQRNPPPPTYSGGN